MGAKGRFGRFIGRFVLFALFICAIILMLALSITAWRLHNAPIKLPDKVRVKIQESLQSKWADVQISDALLYWPRITGSVYVQTHNVKISSTKDPSDVIELPYVAFSLSAPSLITGSIKAKGIIIKDPKIDVDCKNGIKSLCVLSSTENGKKLNWKIPTMDNLGSHILSFESSLPKSLSSVTFIDIKNANLRIESSKNDDRIRYNLAPLRLRAGKAKGAIAAEFYFKYPDQNPLLSGRALLKPKTGKIDASAELPSVNPTELSELLGIKAEIPKDFPNLSLSVRAGYSSKLGVLALKSLEISDGDTIANISGALEYEKEQHSWQGPVDVSMDTIDQMRLAHLWPQNLKANPVYEWLGDKLSGGRIENVKAHAIAFISPANDGNKLQVKVRGAKAAFDMKNMGLDYMSPLPALSNINGTGSIDADTQMLEISTSKGAIVGGMKMGASVVSVDHIFTDNVGRINIQSSIAGDLSDLTAYLSFPPISAQDYVDLDLKSITGNAEIDISLNLPTQPNRPISDLGIIAHGKLKNAKIPNVINDIDLSEANLDLSIDKWLLELNGRGKFGKAPLNLKYKNAIQPTAADFANRINAELEMNDDLLSRLDVNLSPYISGDIKTKISSTQTRDGNIHTGVKADLTNARIDARPLDYIKPKGAPANSALEFKLSKDGGLLDLKILSLKGKDLNASNINVAFNGAKLENALPTKASVPMSIIGNTNAALEYISTPDNSKLLVKANNIDLSSITPQRGKVGNSIPAMDIDIRSKALQIASGHTMKDLTLKARHEKDGRFSMMDIGLATNPGEFNLEYGVQKDNRLAGFIAKTSDIGSILDGVGFKDRVFGGYGQITGRANDAGVVNGTVDLRDFHLINAPVLAKVLGAMSMDGLRDAISGDGGMSFDRVEANFAWNWRPKGAILTLKNGRTSGNSMGLTFEGTFDFASALLAINGTIVPISGINQIAGGVPLVGKLITGSNKGGGIFAATYSVNGSIENPQISTNPLSVLAPGMLRSILFE